VKKGPIKSQRLSSCRAYGPDYNQKILWTRERQGEGQKGSPNRLCHRGGFFSWVNSKKVGGGDAEEKTIHGDKGSGACLSGISYSGESVRGRGRNRQLWKGEDLSESNPGFSPADQWRRREGSEEGTWSMTLMGRGTDLKVEVSLHNFKLGGGENQGGRKPGRAEGSTMEVRGGEGDIHYFYTRLTFKANTKSIKTY